MAPSLVLAGCSVVFLLPSRVSGGQEGIRPAALGLTTRASGQQERGRTTALGYTTTGKGFLEREPPLRSSLLKSVGVTEVSEVEHCLKCQCCPQGSPVP